MIFYMCKYLYVTYQICVTHLLLFYTLIISHQLFRNFHDVSLSTDASFIKINEIIEINYFLIPQSLNN